MRPFSPHLRLRRDRSQPDRLLVESDVPLRAHALALAAGTALVVGGHGLGQLLAPQLGPLAPGLVPLGALLLAVGAWLLLPSMVLTTSVGRELIEIRRSRRKRPQARLLREELLAVRLTAPVERAGVPAPWRLADRQIELVTVAGSAPVAIATANEARALAKGLSAATGAPLRDDTPEAEASYCLQQAMLGAGILDRAPDPPEGFRLRAALEKGWLVLELPPRAPSRLALGLLAFVGAWLLVTPAAIAAWPALGESRWVPAALVVASVAWLAAVVATVSSAHRPQAIAVSPLGVRVTRVPRFGRVRTISLPPPVIAGARLTTFELALPEGARLRLPTSASPHDLAWAAAAVEALAGRPLG